jgi:tripartite-type tricarboxylate transporter receptor subunit TctC
VPTFNELGFDIGALEWLGLLAPAKTPVTSIAELNQAVREALETPQVRESFDNFGIEATGSSPEQFASIMKKDFEFWGRIVKASGFKIDN